MATGGVGPVVESEDAVYLSHSFVCMNVLIEVLTCKVLLVLPTEVFWNAVIQ